MEALTKPLPKLNVDEERCTEVGSDIVQQEEVVDKGDVQEKLEKVGKSTVWKFECNGKGEYATKEKESWGGKQDGGGWFVVGTEQVKNVS
ncbi:uncharacterized protein G2W53_026900 [Senna tora]|uniref:Uncharacterized protein n=1 Tax=Senna tora TaxID=362788 RepID=A0A834TGI1_9FABA|nr:uncharacterized protein G2W53_026900 [Senna tora]